MAILPYHGHQETKSHAQPSGRFLIGVSQTASLNSLRSWSIAQCGGRHYQQSPRLGAIHEVCPRKTRPRRGIGSDLELSLQLMLTDSTGKSTLCNARCDSLNVLERLDMRMSFQATKGKDTREMKTSSGHVTLLSGKLNNVVCEFLLPPQNCPLKANKNPSARAKRGVSKGLILTGCFKVRITF